MSVDNTLQGAIDEFIAVCAGLDDIRRAPDDPEEQVNVWPVAMVYAATGNFETEPAGAFDGLHDVQIAVLMPLTSQSLPLATRIMLPFVETVPEALYEHRNGRSSSHYETFGEIDYSLGPVEWVPESYMYGIIFTVRGVKLVNTLDTP